MSLRLAVLASLLDGPASGYSLAKRMSISISNFWYVAPSQLYMELRRLEEAGLATARVMEQERRPNKRMYTLTAEGRDELARFTRTPASPTAIKDELLVKVQAADVGDPEAVAAALDARRAEAETQLEALENLVRKYLNGRDEGTFLKTTRRVGPYLNMRRGCDFLRENIEWYRWSAEVLRARAGGGGSG
jgi:DNA-binding PadR family transcriptional regulator